MTRELRTYDGDMNLLSIEAIDDAESDAQPEEWTWRGKVTTVNGVATAWVTTSGDDEGEALFGSIVSVQVTTYAEADKVEDVPLASVKRVADDNRCVEVNVVTGRRRVALLKTTAFAPDGTVVEVTVRGV